MKKIQVLGTGCAKCTKLAESVTKIANELSLEYELEKVSDINEIIKYGVMMTPGLVIDGEVKASGRVPKDEELKSMLSGNTVGG